MTEAELIQTLTTALADAHLHLSAKQHAPWLHVYVNRPIGYTPSYSRMAMRLQKAAADLALPDIHMLAINSRIQGADKSDWKTFIDLAQPNRPVSTASDTPTSLGIFETHDHVIPMFAGVSQLPVGYNQLDDDLIMPSSLAGYNNEDSNQKVSNNTPPELINLLDEDVPTRPNFAKSSSASSSASQTPIPSPPLSTPSDEHIAIELAAYVESQTIPVAAPEPTEEPELIDLEAALAALDTPPKQPAKVTPPVIPPPRHREAAPPASLPIDPISEPVSLPSTVSNQFQLNRIKEASAPPPPSVVEPVDVESEIATFLESAPDLTPKRPDLWSLPLSSQATQASSPTPKPTSPFEPLPDTTPEDEVAAFLAAQDEAPPPVVSPPPATPPHRTAASVATKPLHSTQTLPPLGTDAISTRPRMGDDPKTMAPSARSHANSAAQKERVTVKGADLELMGLSDADKNRFLTKPTFTQHDSTPKTPPARSAETRISNWSLEGEAAPTPPLARDKSPPAPPLAKDKSPPAPPLAKDKSRPAPPLARDKSRPASPLAKGESPPPSPFTKAERGNLASYEAPLTLQPMDLGEQPYTREPRAYWKWLLGGFLSLLLMGLAAGGWWLLKEGKISLPILETLLRSTPETTSAHSPKRVINADLCISLKKMLEREQTLNISEMEALLGSPVLQAPVAESAEKGTIYVWQDPSHPNAQLHAIFVEGRLTTIRSCKGVPASP